MLDRLRMPAPGLPVLAAAAWLLAGAAGDSSAQAVDLNGNGMSDVWEQVHGAASLDPAADADGDGVPNRSESIADTDPFDADSLPRVPLAACVGATFSATLWSSPGKQYQLQSTLALGDSNWITRSSLIARTGTVAILTAPAGLAVEYFRAAISDVDTDGDGLSDWEEYRTGLDPFSGASNGQLDGNGQPLGDYDYAVGQLASQNRVAISAPDPEATQPDPGQSAASLGAFLVSRSGFPLNAITVNLALGGPGSGFATENVDHAFLARPVTLPAGASAQLIPVTPLANTNRLAPVVAQMKLQPGAGYTIGNASNASAVIYPSATPLGTGLAGQYFTNASTTYTNVANFNPTNLFLSRVDAAVDFVWTNGTSPNLSNGYYTVRWTGQVQPQYSENYIFDTRTDDGVKLWVNDQLLIDKWQSQGATDWTNAIPLQANVRYNLRMEYFNRGGSGSARLYWFSPSQAKQIIPVGRLYPTTAPSAPSAVTSPLTAVAFLGQPFSYTVTGANSPLACAATNLPPGLSFNATNATLSGTPALAGDFQILLSASNSLGGGSSLLNLQVLDTGSAVTREVWTNVAGTTIASIPVNAAPASSNAFGALEGISSYGDNYAERIRGYLTAPTTGNYSFWIAASDSAELWISNDGEAVNKVRRAYVLPSANPAPPPANGTASRQWKLQANQKSPWLALEAGQRYYVEILHKAGAGANDNWAVGWRQDPTGTNDTPAEVVPGHLLSRYFPPPPSFVPGTLYTANLLPQGTAASSGVGSATLRVSADGTQAVLKRSFSGLTSPMTGEHIHSDPYLNSPSQIMFDIDDVEPEADGSFVWNIGPVGTLSAADILEILRQGKAYINLHTVNYPAGEINGHFTLAEGSPTFTPPPAPPVWTDDHANSNAAARFLIQATFGPSASDLAAVQALGYEGWINQQFALPVTSHLSNVLAGASADPSTPYNANLTFNTWWRHSVTAPDQLRQRVAFALSEILVVSENGVLQDNARALSSYYDVLLSHAFGNFRELLEAMTLTPAMGLYLDMRRNDKGDLALGRHPNENFAREILQLFSLGLYRLWPDGTLVLNSQDSLVPTYSQEEVLGFSRVFTGWNYYQPNQPNGRFPTNWNPSANYTNAMVLVPTHHELGTKRLLDNVELPQAWGSQADAASANFDSYCAQDLELALDSIFRNDSVGPFICRQLIQRLVTSHPSRDYLYRVVQQFNDNGAGVRGDLAAVIKAILLDYEARSASSAARPTFGKQREPLLRVTAPARAFPSPPPVSGTYSQNGSQTVTVTTAGPHRLNNNDDVFCVFTDASGQPAPPAQAYPNVIATSPTTFTLTAPGLATGTYGQTGSVISVTNTGHGLAAGNPVYLVFTSGGASNGLYPVATVPASSNFTVTASDSVTRAGNCLFPKLTGGGYQVQNTTNVTVSTALQHGLLPGNNVYLGFTGVGGPADGTYAVATVPDATHFTVIVPASGNLTDNGLVTYPLVAPPLARSGNVTVRFSTWLMNATDTGSTSSLLQSPLGSPTVFNFFFPDYKFPGVLAAAGLTTPEFQLTSDTSVALQMNFLQGGVLTSTGNTNGLSSFAGGNGAIMLDLGPWMTPGHTSAAGVPALVESLNTLLCAGQLSAGAKSLIAGYVTNTVNFPYGSPPTSAQMRDRVRAAVHLIVVSPDFTIQK